MGRKPETWPKGRIKLGVFGCRGLACLIIGTDTAELMAKLLGLGHNS